MARVNNQQSATLDEVAAAAGVSRATASRAITGKGSVSPAARAAVEEAVRTLRYRPNQAARSLVTRRTDSVALVVPEPDERVFPESFFARTVRGANRVLAERDLMLALLIARPGEDDRMLRYLRNRHLDGALVVSHHRSDSLAEHLTALAVPCAFVGRPWTSSEKVAYVDTDNLAGSEEATRLLVQRGCRRIAHVAGPSDMTAGLDRLEGWRRAMRAAGLTADAVVHGDFSQAGGAKATTELLTLHPDIDGIVAASDLMALGALEALSVAGRRVPEDVAVVGYDDLGAAEQTDPPLTTVRNPIEDMAGQATRLLLGQLDGVSLGMPMRVIYPPSLVRRASA